VVFEGRKRPGRRSWTPAAPGTRDSTSPLSGPMLRETTAREERDITGVCM
jgi:hypothetical protein